MSIIHITLLDSPTVRKNEQPVKLSYRKAEAILYYLAVKKKASRRELMTHFWGDLPDETARNNLRNALYRIRKTLGADAVLTPGQVEIYLNPAIEYVIDIDGFLSDEPNAWQLYRRGFLHGFYVKNANDFDEWMTEFRQLFMEQYVRKLHAGIKNAKDEGNYEGIIEMARHVVREDPYDEVARRYLMECYAIRGEVHHAVQEYESITEILRKDLGIQPETETIKLYETIMQQRNSVASDGEDSTSNPVFYGREQEMHQLQQKLDAFLQSSRPEMILVSGEAGIGKTFLMRRLIQQEAGRNYHVLEANCYQQEESFLLKPWQPIFSDLLDLIIRESIELPYRWVHQMAHYFPVFEALLESHSSDGNLAEVGGTLQQPILEAASGVFKRAAVDRKIILFFEDIHWMDATSRQLIQRMLQESSLSVLFAATVRDGYEDRLNELTTVAGRRGILHRIPLERFSEAETIWWTHQELVKLSLDHMDYQQVYLETRGNPFFVSEYLNALKTYGSSKELSSRAQDMLQSRLHELAPDTRKLLELASLFFHRVPLQTITAVSSADEEEAVDMLQQLIQRGILREVVEGNKISVEFIHQRFREYIYEQQSLAKRRLLHARVGKQLEKNLKGNSRDLLRYTDLIHHYKRSGDLGSALKYTVKYLNAYLDYYHELFPSAFYPNNLPQQSLYLTLEETRRYFSEVEQIMREMDPEEFQLEETRQWQISYLHLKGRLLIREGEYDTGLLTTKKMIALAEESGHWNYAISGYQQITNYGIQTQQLEIMKKNIEDAMKLASLHGFDDKIPVLLRLLGLYKLMNHEFDQAENVLYKAIDVTDKSHDKDHQHVVHLSACRYYLGEIKRNQGKHKEAILEYKRAVADCEEQGAQHHSIAVFYTGMGQAYVELGLFEEGEKCLKQALGYFRQYEIFWRRSIANAYLALIQAEKCQPEAAKNYLKDAKIFASMLKNPYELNVLHRMTKIIEEKLN